jgi:undecaprenyl-diphosphatase
VFVGLSALGYAGLVWIGLAAGAALFASRPVLPAAVLTAACVWTADLIALGIKSASGRPRPFEALPEIEPLLGGTVGTSLPSGHAATSFAGAVVLTYLFPRAWPAFFLLALAISFSRIYVGVHYPSDLLAGAALGAAVSLAAISAVRLRRRSEAARRRSGAAPPAG